MNYKIFNYENKYLFNIKFLDNKYLFKDII